LSELGNIVISATMLQIEFTFLSCIHKRIYVNMEKEYDVIIIGGSYAGLSAAMALGRSIRRVLIIDSGKPCNRQTPHSHNFITHDGEVPAIIAQKAKEQVLKYSTVRFTEGLAVSGERVGNKFQINLKSGQSFHAEKLLFATGVEDIMPAIDGFSECWGISVLHCPYCHGYEVRNKPTGIIANGDFAFELARLIHHWTKDLVVFTNGMSTLTSEQWRKIESHNIRVEETILEKINHKNGYVNSISLKGGKDIKVNAIYARPALVQHCTIPQELGCEVNEQNLLKVDAFHRTNVPGIYAAGDNTSMMRSVSLAVAGGGFAGAVINKEIIETMF
jgi:thioredoxin reductase